MHFQIIGITEYFLECHLLFINIYTITINTISAGPPQRVYQEMSNQYTARLNINDLRVEDAGQYKCEVGPLEAPMQLNVRGKYCVTYKN